MLRFAKDIRPLFRHTPDVDSMRDYGLDLASYVDVKANAEKIHAALADGSMPCDRPWHAGRIALFRRWIDEGMNP